MKHLWQFLRWMSQISKWYQWLGDIKVLQNGGISTLLPPLFYFGGKVYNSFVNISMTSAAFRCIFSVR